MADQKFDEPNTSGARWRIKSENTNELFRVSKERLTKKRLLDKFDASPAAAPARYKSKAVQVPGIDFDVNCSFSPIDKTFVKFSDKCTDTSSLSKHVVTSTPATNDYFSRDVKIRSEPDFCDESNRYALNSYPISDNLTRQPLHEDRWVKDHEKTCHYNSSQCSHSYRSFSTPSMADLRYARHSYPSGDGLIRRAMHSCDKTRKPAKLQKRIADSADASRRLRLEEDGSRAVVGFYHLLFLFLFLCFVILLIIRYKFSPVAILNNFRNA